MRIAWAGRALPGVFLVVLAGCTSVNPRPDYERVERHVAEAVGENALAPADDAEAVRALVAARLEGGLSADEAVQVCLLNNPRVRSALLRVGIARAELVQAGLFQNPSLSLSLRLPDGGGLSNLELGIAQNIAELWLIPIRKRVAEGELESAILEVARELSAVALEARAAYYSAVGLGREKDIVDENRAVAEQLLDAALARMQAGAGSSIDVNLARSEFMQTEVALRNAALAAFEGRRSLAVLLGIRTPPDDLVLTDKLPDPPAWTLTSESLVRTAEANRLDLRAATYFVDVAAARVQQEKMSVVANVEVGVGFERDARGRRGDRPWLADTLWASAEAGALTAPSLRPREKQPTDTILGPTLSLEVPVFDQNQAQIAKVQFIYEQALLNREALLLDVTQETRGAFQRARTAWDVANYYRDNFLPLLQENLELSRTAYRAGKISLLSVLEAQKLLLASRGRYVESLRNAAVAVTDLEKAIGTPLARVMSDVSTTTTQPASRPASEVQP